MTPHMSLQGGRGLGMRCAQSLAHAGGLQYRCVSLLLRLLGESCACQAQCGLWRS